MPGRRWEPHTFDLFAEVLNGEFCVDVDQERQTHRLRRLAMASVIKGAHDNYPANEQTLPITRIGLGGRQQRFIYRPSWALMVSSTVIGGVVDRQFNTRALALACEDSDDPTLTVYTSDLRPESCRLHVPEIPQLSGERGKTLTMSNLDRIAQLISRRAEQFFTAALDPALQSQRQ